MSSTRTNISEKNPYHINKERYLELKHFCAQVPTWMADVKTLQTQRYLMKSSVREIPRNTNDVHRPTEVAEPSDKEIDLIHRIDIFNKALSESMPYTSNAPVDLVIRTCFFKSVIGSASYDRLSSYYPELIFIPRDTWYYSYRKFFWVLDQSRK